MPPLGSTGKAVIGGLGRSFPEADGTFEPVLRCMNIKIYESMHYEMEE